MSIMAGRAQKQRRVIRFSKARIALCVYRKFALPFRPPRRCYFYFLARLGRADHRWKCPFNRVKRSCRRRTRNDAIDRNPFAVDGERFRLSHRRPPWCPYRCGTADGGSYVLRHSPPLKTAIRGIALEWF